MPRRLNAWTDVLVAAVLLALGQWQVWGDWADGGVGTPPHANLVARAALVVLFTVPLAWRRRRPLTVVAVVCGAIVCQLLLVVAYVPFLTGLVPMAIANYTAAAYGNRWRALSLVCVLATEAVVWLQIPAERVSGEVLFAVFVAVGTWLIGDVVRVRSTRAQRVLGDAERLVARSERAAALAVAEERSRIARELHDVIAHSVSVMGVQAGAARTLVEGDPDAARAALLEVEAAARASVGELQRLLTVLREDGSEAATRAPQPGLAQVGELVAQVRAAGLPVELVGESDPRLPPGVDLVAYRIVQESLTNALKHAGGPTRVAIAREGGLLTIDVVNDRPVAGPPSSPPAEGCGHGLIGMRERVQLYSGTLSAGPEPDGGFAVRARIPVAADPVLDVVR